MSGEIIPFEGLKERREAMDGGLSGKERGSLRIVLQDFGAYRDACPMARRLVDETSPSDLTGRFSACEVDALRTMLKEFAAIKYSCPSARRILEA